MNHNDDSLVCYGGDIKAIGDGKFTGTLVRFGSPEDADCQDDFFAADTNYGLDVRSSLWAVYHHGLDLKGDDLAKRLHKRCLTTVAVKSEPTCLMASGSLDLSDPDLRKLYGEIEAGNIGFSSGSVERLVRREAVKGKNKITQWLLVEASLTPRPVEPRNKVMAIKALADEAEAGEAVAASLVDRTEALVADARKLVALYGKAADQRLTAGRHLSERKRSAIKALADQLAEIHRRTGSGPADELRAELARTLLARRIGANHG